MPANVTTLISNTYNLEKLVVSANLLIGVALVPGSRAPILVNKALVSRMKKGSVIVDVAVDQGGCVEIMRPTTHHDPIFNVDDVVHCGIANLPRAVPRTATMALCNATMPYILDIANEGWQQACHRNPGLAHDLNIVHGNVTHAGVAESVGLNYHPLPHDIRRRS
jgi:alanine dehydrogenase